MLYGLKEKEVQFPRGKSAQLPPEGERRVGSMGSSGREELTQLCPVTAAQSPVGAAMEHEEVTRQLDGWVWGLSALPKVMCMAVTASQSELAPTPGVRWQISDVCRGACGAERSRGDWTAVIIPTSPDCPHRAGMPGLSLCLLHVRVPTAITL